MEILLNNMSGSYKTELVNTILNINRKFNEKRLYALNNETLEYILVNARDNNFIEYISINGCGYRLLKRDN